MTQNPSFVLSEDKKKLQEILAATFDLTNKQAKLLVRIVFQKNQICCLNYLTETMRAGRSTLQKYIKVLLDKGLVKREAKTLAEFEEICKNQNRKHQYKTTKGYLYVYTAIKKEKLLKMAEDKWNSWREQLDLLL